jgi:hypothetical protein
MLGLSLDNWNNLLVVSLSITGIAASIVAAATWVTISLSKSEAEQAKQELESYKITVEGKVADAKREGIQAGKMAGDAILRAAELEKQAAELKAANLALEAKIQPRRLSSDKAEAIANILSSIPPLAITIVSRMTDIEGKDFADDLALAFNKAKWNTSRIEMWTGAEKGVFIAVTEGTQVPTSVGGALAAALDAANIQHKTITIRSDDMQRIPPTSNLTFCTFW